MSTPKIEISNLQFYKEVRDLFIMIPRMPQISPYFGLDADSIGPMPTELLLSLTWSYAPKRHGFSPQSEGSGITNFIT